MDISTKIIVFHIVFCGFFIIVGTKASRTIRARGVRLSHEGDLAEAEIVGYEEIEQRFVNYRFTPIGNLNPVDCRKVIEGCVKQFPIGTRVPVRYKREDPSTSILVPYAGSQWT